MDVKTTASQLRGWVLPLFSTHNALALSMDQILDHIMAKHKPQSKNTPEQAILLCTVNHPDRVYFRINKQVRAATTDLDLFYLNANLTLELYDRKRHGDWQIRAKQSGGFEVHCRNPKPKHEANFVFPTGDSLRDFFAANLSNFQINGKRLSLYTDVQGKTGVEYPTEAGPIDILAVDESGDFVVIEMKLSKGVDATMGQICRYVGWMKRNLGKGKKVIGAIVAKKIDDKLKFATYATPDIIALEYNVDFSMNPVQ